MYKNIDLFEARKDGYHVYRIPGIIVTKNNVIVASTEARNNRGGDWDPIDVFIRRSFDQGDTFQERQLIVDHKKYGEGPAGNFVLIPNMRTGRVIALYCYKYSRVFTMFSDDDCGTFSEPVEITDTFNQFHQDYDWKVCATGPGHGIQLENGRMIVPVWLSDGSGSEFGKGNLGHRPSIVTSIHSDDNGMTWNRGDIVCQHNDKIEQQTLINPSETIAVQLSDSSVMFNIRSESEINRRLIAISSDGATNWKIKEFDNSLLEPVCMASILKSNQKKIDGPQEIIFINPDTLENDMRPEGNNLSHDRKRLTAKCSQDNGETWPISKIIEPGPAGYSDLAQLASGEFLCLYECEIIDRICDDKYIRLTKFDSEWLQS